jgi:predicted nucleotide-binding protein
MAETKATPAKAATTSKRAKVSQLDFPRFSLEKSLSIPQAIWDHFAGKGGAPHEIALSLDLAPTSGGWRNLCGASIAYGLTEGGYAASEITLTDLGRRIVAPEEDGDDIRAMAEAIQKPKVLGEFLRKYDKAKFPSDAIAINVLVGMGLPKDRGSVALSVLKANGEKTGIFKNTKTGLFVALSSRSKPNKKIDITPEEEIEDNGEAEIAAETDEAFARRLSNAAATKREEDIPKDLKTSNKVFISHGKNREIVGQLKELITFGNFEPVVSVEKEATAIPVPEKVFEDMRACGAAVIHVNLEETLFDKAGNEVQKINENVLIEIGAAIALYGKRFVLLVEKGVKLPSNLQGLYRCEYEGKKLDYDATMKLLKIFNELRK